MSSLEDIPVPAATRLRLARTAQAAAVGVHGVVCLEQTDEPTRRTVSGSEVVSGVTCMATGGGTYDIVLHVVARPVPLPALAGRIRAAVFTAVMAEGLRARLSAVDVFFCDVVEPEPA